MMYSEQSEQVARSRPGRVTAKALGVIVLVLAMLSVTTGCVPQATSPSLSATPSSQKQLSHWYNQSLNWTKCGKFQCAEAKVPLDWSKATSDTSSDNTISISLIRHKATGKSIGTLFTNPGGPGSSGVSLVKDSYESIFDTRLISNYDIVGWDPRGVGESSAVKCFTSSAKMDSFLYGLPTYKPNTAKYFNEVVESTKEFGAACQKKTGELLSHVDTASSVKDMDILRAAVNSSVFNYLGFSYGTKLGLLYAQEFPSRVGRVVLDGVMDTNLSGNAVSLGQVSGFDRTIKSYLKHCLGTKSPACPFTGSVDDASDQLVDLIKDVQEHPITNSDGRKLGVSTLITAIAAAMYSDSSWSYLTTALTEVKAGTATTAFMLADFYNDREDGKYTTNTTEAFTAINCLDYQVEGSKTQIATYQKALRKASKILGPFYADGSVSCKGWPVAATGHPQVVTANGAAGMLLVGTTGDPATPYEWAKRVASRIPASRLLTVSGNQHTAYSASASTCVINSVDNYLLNGALPKSGATCKASSD